MNDSKILPLARTHTRALQQFLCFCFHNLHRFLCNSLLFNHLPVIFGQFLTLTKSQIPHQHSKTQHLSQHNSLTYNPSPHLLPLFLWRLWKQKVTTTWCVRAHARGFFVNVKISIRILPTLWWCTSPNHTALSPTFFHYRIFHCCSPSAVSHSPSTFALDDYLCFACTLRPLSRNSAMSTLQNQYPFKKNLHFSSIFSLFHLISSHILIGTHPFGAPSIIYFPGESQTTISFPTSSIPTQE